MRVNVYRNLNKRPTVVYSIQHKGKVIDWRTDVFIVNVTAKHPNAKQCAAVRSGPRQVCAWLKGDLSTFDPSLHKDGERLQFDPKVDDSFPFDQCEWAHFTPLGVFIKK